MRSRAVSMRRSRAVCSRGPKAATWPANARPSGDTCTAASVGVRARRSAARSASETSISCPTPHTIGMGEAATARTSTSSLNDHRSSRLPPPRTNAITSGRGSRRAAAAQGRRQFLGAQPPLHAGRAPRSRRSISTGRERAVRKSAIAAPWGCVTTAIRRGKAGIGRFRPRRRRALRDLQQLMRAPAAGLRACLPADGVEAVDRELVGATRRIDLQPAVADYLQPVGRLDGQRLHCARARSRPASAASSSLSERYTWPDDARTRFENLARHPDVREPALEVLLDADGHLRHAHDVRRRLPAVGNGRAIPGGGPVIARFVAQFLRS